MGGIKKGVFRVKLSEEEKKELLHLFPQKDFDGLKKHIFADNPGSREAVREFTDLLQFMHKLAGHPRREFKAIEGVFLL